ncbi:MULTISPECIES: sarcosine oxidase subunit gamma family protein [unclassified Amycolatopsis]|uniref:sarcosine oxidase subunit gamma n=1 Tax=unclassified Amycolatopsis TaxID=2618356 RepID=UPI002875082A|nr:MULTISPECIES: sarcosine oxidase subunit gamma family protein [unclassified Amycolatopsis]MDS0132118.1 sarcosine oxidase subunit gamma [Amycolatopsis sp. 505]MDS0141144.1 sarcosine oxidase subunit gamma [Amycolatopsis sp. CM201R]
MTVDLTEEKFRTQLTVRLREGESLLGVPLPGACTFTSGNGVEILWMGPDEYLVLAEPGRQAELEAALSRECDAVVDVSAQRNVYRLTGSHAADVLAHGCSIDLEVSPPGTCVQTLFARTGIVLMVREDCYTILVRQSFSDYFRVWLADASLEYVP